MSGFKCPFCGEIINESPKSETVFLLNASGVIKLYPFFFIKHKYMELIIHTCQNKSCGKTSVIINGKNGYIDNQKIQVYPKAVFRRFPDFVPEAIRADYEEASKIIEDSPKAAATLCRRCLQGIIRDCWNIKRNRLIDEIKELQGKIPAAQWEAIDALRKLGNIGAHMGKDVNTIVEIDDNEAEMLLQLIELLIERWYIDRHGEEELYNQIAKSSFTKKKGPNSYN